ncbi:CU044_2847 family protein [Kovacikia minuta]|uniref:CU044_2847 family protein n=1 Tax=Kovacikia minuta TaxID=2931930 RepID=UPI0020C74D26|nr:CU044_2847 family protein [Kovacikia minuta]
MDKEIAQFSLEDGTKFLVEVDEPEGVAVERVAIDTGQMVLQARESFEEAIEIVKPVASVLISKLKRGLTTPANEVEVKFGLKSEC